MNQSKKNLMIKDTAFYAMANYIAQGLGVINSIALRRFMGPAAMGVWSILQVILGYCGYASFGTTKAMARDYPYLRGKGEHEKAEQLKDMTLTFSILMSVIPAMIICVYLALKWNTLDVSLRVGLAFIAIFLFVQRFYDLIITLLRSDKKFTTLSGLIVINAIGTLAISFFLVFQWNIYGLLAGTALVTFACLGFICKASPYRFRAYWNTQELWRELRLGVPLVAITFLFEFLKSLDKLIIAKKLGFYEVGLYSIAMMANSYIFSLPMMFAHVWYPNLQQEYGRSGDIAAVKNYLLTPVWIFSIMCPFLCGAAIFFMPPLAQLFLPKFIPGIPAMKIYLVGTFFMLLAQYSGNFLVTLDKYWVNVPILIVSIATNALSSLIFLKMGWGLQGIAAATCLSFFVYGIISYIVALKHFASPREIFSNISRMIFLLLALLGVVFLLDAFIALKNPYVEAVMKMVLFTVFVSPFFWTLEKRIGLLNPLKELVFKKKPILEIEEIQVN